MNGNVMNLHRNHTRLQSPIHCPIEYFITFCWLGDKSLRECVKKRHDTETFRNQIQRLSLGVDFVSVQSLVLLYYREDGELQRYETLWDAQEQSQIITISKEIISSATILIPNRHSASPAATCNQHSLDSAICDRFLCDKAFSKISGYRRWTTTELMPNHVVLELLIAITLR